MILNLHNSVQGFNLNSDTNKPIDLDPTLNAISKEKGFSKIIHGSDIVNISSSGTLCNFFQLLLSGIL